MFSEKYTKLVSLQKIMKWIDGTDVGISKKTEIFATSIRLETSSRNIEAIAVIQAKKATVVKHGESGGNA